MNFRSFVGTDHERARRLLQEAKVNQKGKDSRSDCTNLLDDLLGGDFSEKSFLEARNPDGKLCGIAVYDLDVDYLYVELLCSDCKGTGTELIRKLSQLAMRSGKPAIRLTAVSRAREFYEKMGFVPLPPDENPRGNVLERKVGGRRNTYRRRKHRKHGSASLRRHKTRRVLP